MEMLSAFPFLFLFHEDFQTFQAVSASYLTETIGIDSRRGYVNLVR